MAPLFLLASLLLFASPIALASFYGASGGSKLHGWNNAHATFHTGSGLSSTMGGACGFGDLYSNGYGTDTTSVSAAIFNSGVCCGACYEIKCDVDVDRQWCLGGQSVVVTATNFCPPNHALTHSDGGWCNPPLHHFHMTQPAFQKIGVYGGGIVPVLYRRVPCVKTEGARFTVNGNPHFMLVLVTDVGGVGDIVSVSIKGEKTGWQPMTRNWGQNWLSNAKLEGQSLSFLVTTSEGKSMTYQDVISANWKFGQTFSGGQLL